MIAMGSGEHNALVTGLRKYYSRQNVIFKIYAINIDTHQSSFTMGFRY